MCTIAHVILVFSDSETDSDVTGPFTIISYQNNCNIDHFLEKYELNMEFILVNSNPKQMNLSSEQNIWNTSQFLTSSKLNNLILTSATPRRDIIVFIWHQQKYGSINFWLNFCKFKSRGMDDVINSTNDNRFFKT